MYSDHIVCLQKLNMAPNRFTFCICRLRCLRGKPLNWATKDNHLLLQTISFKVLWYRYMYNSYYKCFTIRHVYVETWSYAVEIHNSTYLNGVQMYMHKFYFVKANSVLIFNINVSLNLAIAWYLNAFPTDWGR